MKVISTNIGQRKTVIWQGQEVETGIFKDPVNHPLTLEATDVKGDHVIDRRYHGGVDKACYLYSVDHYAFWKEKYPDLDWSYGMFGENLSLSDCDERQVFIGDTYQAGSAVIQVSQPRQPCFKLGVRFGDQGVLKEFINQSYSGIYVRVLKPGEVSTGDELQLIERAENSVTVADVFRMLYHGAQDSETLEKVLANSWLSATNKEYLSKKYSQ
ncbi:MOSC domain-containing protein [bacterium SCSIO 12741]|nr:MOSC domain-containing protein [bacterium SCSIO 12741]